MVEAERVSILLNGIRTETAVGTVLSEAIRAEQPCGGHGKCGKCKVIAHGALSPVGETERAALTEEELQSGVRLACCVTVLGACEVRSLRESAQSEILTDGAAEVRVLDPVFRRYGVALDIGTTTLAARLYDGTGRMRGACSRLNPQARWGADVISRIEASMGGAAHALATAIRSAIDEMLLELSDGAGISAKEIDGIVLTGNTAMLYFLTESDPKTLSRAPFCADRLFGESLRASSLGLLSPDGDAEIVLPSCIGAFVGADTACAILATGLCRTQESALLVDIGTNGEIALWQSGRLSVASTAAGPAFEGVGISMGMRGETGAIDRVVLANGSLHAHVIGNVAPRGICGSGLVDAVACLLLAEEIDETGYLEEDPVTVSEPVVLTGKDIRMVQLAKSAICAGIRTLLSEAGVTEEQIGRLFIAGGFGNYLDVANAGRIGLLPPTLVSKVETVGNAALDGAAMLLCDRSLLEECRRWKDGARLVELSTNAVFSEYYVDGMMF